MKDKLYVFLFISVIGSVINAQLPEKVSPDVYKVLLENEDVKVLEVTFKPGQSDNFHKHNVMTFYAVQGGSLQVTSPDGTTWTQQTSGLEQSLESPHDNFKGIAHGNGLFVVVAISDGTIFTSMDGIIWTSQTSGTTNNFENSRYLFSQSMAFARRKYEISRLG